MLTKPEVLAQCGISESTLDRARKAGAFPSAYQETGGRKQWLYPVTDLIAAGMTPKAPAGEGVQTPVTKVVQKGVRTPSRQPRDDGQTAQVAQLEAELAAARAEAAEERSRRLVAEERVTMSRELIAVHERRADEAVRALLMLGPGETPTPEPLQVPATEPEKAPRRRWLFGRGH